MDSERARASFLPVIEEALATHAAGRWDLETAEAPGEAWISARPREDRTPDQGWKLHVSATAESSGEVLEQALRILFSEDAAFKVAASPAAVEFLNEGLAGLSQIGKFVTVYPRDDRQAVRLATDLDRATRGLEGPQVPSDRPLCPGSLVHYRYGGFVEKVVYSSSGQQVPTILAGGGRWVPDPREQRYGKPSWLRDPFEDAGVAENGPSKAIAGRYAVVVTLHRSPRGATHLAVDLQSLRSVVLKQAGRHARARPGLGDARDQLRWEAEVLRRLESDPRFPRALDVVEHGGDLFLALERFEGEPLGRRVTRLAASGRLTPREQIVAWGRELAAALGDLHASGLAFRDLSPLNVIVGLDGRLRLVDFELAAVLGSDGSGEAVGTVGYASPQQYRGEVPSVLDDVYGVGAVMFLAATGTDPVFMEDRETFLERPLTLMNPAIGDDLAAVIDRCREPRPERRFQEAAGVERALGGLPDAAPRTAGWGERLGADRRAHYAELTAEVAEQLASWTLRGPEDGLPSLESLESRMELAGAILALIAVGPAEVEDGVEAVAAGAGRLAALPPTGAAGLYLGEGGLAVTLARAGRFLGDSALTAVAGRRGEHLASLSPRGLDLFGGAAGALRAQLLLWRESGHPNALRAAGSRGDDLLAAAEDAGEGRLRWRSPPEPGEAEGALFVGYAHGTAGIGDALLDLAEATGERRYRDAAAAAARWVGGLAAPALEDGSGVAWPEREGGEATPPIWCLGSVGIGRFYLHLAAAGALERALETAERAARTAARGGRFLGPTSCHGLVGSIELLLDVHAATGDPGWLDEAAALARLLEAFRTEDGDWRSDSGEPLPFDLLTGRAGVAVCLARMSDPGRAWRLLDPGCIREGGPVAAPAR